MKRTEVIGNFLKLNTHSDLAQLYTPNMEVQVNVRKENGETIDVGKLGSKPSIAYTDGIQTWKSFRIPHNAMSEPVDNDSHINWDFDRYVEAIGMTGWDWRNKVSRWVAYDFDAMCGHSEKHGKRLTDSELQEVQDLVLKLDFITLRRSTSGRGLHVYVFTDKVRTENHTEHAALARSILSMMTGLTGFNFADKVDVCGSNMWVYHRKMIGTPGLSIVKQGKLLTNIPPNWKDHLNVISKRANRIKPSFDVKPNLFDELTGQQSKIKLEDEHIKLIEYHEKHNLRYWFDPDNHMLVTHTTHLLSAHKDLLLKGEFHTVSTGKEFGADVNCFAYPGRNGIWSVYRYSLDSVEHKYWIQEKGRLTRCTLNRDLMLEDVCRMFEAIEIENGSYQFHNVSTAKSALLKLGLTMDSIPDFERPVRVKYNSKDRKVIISFQKIEGDPNFKDWLPEKGQWKKVFRVHEDPTENDSIPLAQFDSVLRKLTTVDGQDMGWSVNGDGICWRTEPLANVKPALAALGVGAKDITMLLGSAVLRPWTIVNIPFKDEYPGDRCWNRSKAKFKVVPSLEENVTHPMWTRVLENAGKSLNSVIAADKWCIENGVKTGGDYLKLWFACLVQYPEAPLPYLAFYGEQDVGKSTLHEAFTSFILSGGFIDGRTALQSGANFNGELAGTILCTLEEVDLRSPAIYNKVKDWVTSPNITIHEKGMTPYRTQNYTHWIQCVNNRAFIPVFAGDKRITVFYVELNKEEMVAKGELFSALEKEAPDFLNALLNTQIPNSKERLKLPVLNSSDKEAAEFSSMSVVEQFFHEKVYKIDGALVTSNDLFDAFSLYIGTAEAVNWTRNKFGRSVPSGITRGRYYKAGNNDTHYGNISLSPDTLKGKRLVTQGIKLVEVE